MAYITENKSGEKDRKGTKMLRFKGFSSFSVQRLGAPIVGHFARECTNQQAMVQESSPKHDYLLSCSNHSVRASQAAEWAP